MIDLLDQIVQSHPDQIALIHGEQRISYRELDRRSREIGAFFQRERVQPGQRALLLTPLGIDFYIIFLGLARIGVTVMLIDPMVGKAQMMHCCSIAQPDLFVGSPKAHLLRLPMSAIRKIPQKFTTVGWMPGSKPLRSYRGWLENRTFLPCNKYGSQTEQSIESNAGDCQDAPISAETPALITFTSGSTSLPKGICRTHGFLARQHEVLCQTIAGEAGEIELNTLPVFILSSLARGITVVMPKSMGKPPAKIDPAEVVHEIERNGVNRLLAAPAFCQRLADHLERQNTSLSTIRRIYTGGGPVFPRLLTKLTKQMPNANLVAVYGSTEAEPIAHIDMNELAIADQRAMQRGSGLLAGQPVPQIKLAILPDTVGKPLEPLTEAAFAEMTLPPNCVGEIVVTGTHVQKGYLNQDNGLIKFRVGDTIWHRTGDAGYLDATGRLWLLGRCSARVIHNGSVQYPFGLEAAAMAHPEVERAAFVEVDGEAVLAIQAEPTQWQTLSQQLMDCLPIVDRLQRVAAIPVDMRHGSKVLYSEVRQLVGEPSG